MKRHHGACGNINVLAKDPMHSGAAECDCQSWNMNPLQRFIAWLKACCTLQHPLEGEPVLLTTFGRAHSKSSRKWHPGWMMYWVKLPSWQWKQDFVTLRYGWHQAVLRFHGAFGFEIYWVWVQGQDIVRSEQDDWL